MLQRRTSVTIARSVDDVFGVLSDVEKTAIWHPTTVEEHWTSEGETRVGSTRRAVAVSFGVRAQNDAVVTRYEPGKALGLRSTESPVPFEIGIELSEVSEGTRVECDTVMRPSGVYRLFGSILMSVYLRQLDAGLSRLKDLMESNRI